MTNKWRKQALNELLLFRQSPDRTGNPLKPRQRPQRPAGHTLDSYHLFIRLLRGSNRSSVVIDSSENQTVYCLSAEDSSPEAPHQQRACGGPPLCASPFRATESSFF